MAEGLKLTRKTLTELEREIICAICQEHYKEPKLLPCGHYFCKECILKLVFQVGADKPFSCPECREGVLLHKSVDELQTAFFINRIKANISTLEGAYSEGEVVKHKTCKDHREPLTVHCFDCDSLICIHCLIEGHREHQVQCTETAAPDTRKKLVNELKPLREENVISSEAVVEEPTTRYELEAQDLSATNSIQTTSNHIEASTSTLEGADGEVVQQGTLAETMAKAEDYLVDMCSVHPKEPIMLYCFKCDSLTCHRCIVNDHNGHTLAYSETAASDTRKKLMEELKPLRKVNVILSEAMVEVQTTRHELEAQGIAVANDIQASFFELQKIMDDRKRELLEEAERKVKEKIDRLSLQEEKMSLVCADVQSIVDHIEECVGNHADNEVLDMHTELSRQIQQWVKEHKGVVSLEPLEEADVGVEVRCAEALKQLCQTKAKLIQPSTVVSDNLKISELLNNVTGCVLTTVKRINSIDCHLKSLSSGSIIKCNADRIGARKYSIQYTPTVRGQCELTVSVDGQQVAHSPFSVFVAVPVAQLGKPVNTWRALSRPTAIAVNSVGEVVVSEEKENIIIFDREGKRSKSVKHKLEMCSSVAVDDECNNIYCTDLASNKIVRCKRNIGRGKVHKVKQIQGPGHWAVAIVGDEVMVCEYGNGGAIMVYDRELKYVREIAGTDMGKFLDLSPDNHGNLYVADFSNSLIRVFNINGDLLRSFGCDENGVKKLSGPRGVCVAGQYVYVADGGLHNVSVFTTEGAYMTSFGRSGCEDGDFMSPCGLCVDKDGFVYVADCSSDRVQIF